MKYLKKFESLSYDNKLSSFKDKVKDWIDLNKNNSEFNKLISNAIKEFQKLDRETKMKLKNISEHSRFTENINEFEYFNINENSNWKNTLIDVFKFLGITSTSIGFILTIWAISSMIIKDVLGFSWPGEVGSVSPGSKNIVVILLTIIPIIISVILRKSGKMSKEESEKNEFVPYIWKKILP